MAEFLELARVILERRESAKSATFQLNEHQCNRLWRNLRSHYDYYLGTLLYLQPTWLRSIFLEFYLIVTRADAIQQHFSSACSWLQAAALQGDHRKAFKILDQDLKGCALLFRETTKSLSSMLISSSDKISWRLDETEEDSEKDLSILRTALQQFNTDNEDEIRLAEHILAREASKSSTDNDQGASFPKFYTQITHGYPTSLKRIGGGASGSVYKVKWLGMICAKKHFNATGFTQEILKEVKTLALSNHPNILKLLCVGDGTTEASFLMEYMPMSLLAFYTQRKNSDPISLLAAIDIMQQFSRGMEYLHEQDIVHRDLKSTNVLVAPSADEKLQTEGYVDLKVADLGSAKISVSNLTWPTQDMIGTTKWRAPEVFDASLGPIDWKKADVYSYAMTCSEILTGKVPFTDRECERTKLLPRILSGERPVLPLTCPKELRTLLEDCWNNEPTRRPSFSVISKRLASIKAAAIANTEPPQIKVKPMEMKCKSKATSSTPTLVEASYKCLKVKPVKMKCKSKATSSTPTLVEASHKCLGKPLLNCLTQALGNKYIAISLCSTFILVPFFTSQYQK